MRKFKTSVNATEPASYLISFSHGFLHFLGFVGLEVVCFFVGFLGLEGPGRFPILIFFNPFPGLNGVEGLLYSLIEMGISFLLSVHSLDGLFNIVPFLRVPLAPSVSVVG